MAVRTIGCGSCGAVVPYGRLSCPECGELLASVAGSIRHTSVATMSDVPDDDAPIGQDPALEPVDALEPDEPPAPVAAAPPEPAPARAAVAPASGAIPSVLREPGDLASMAPPAWPTPPVADDGIDALDMAFPPVTSPATTWTPDAGAGVVAAAEDPASIPASAPASIDPGPSWPTREAPTPGAYVPPPPFGAVAGVGGSAAMAAVLPGGPAAPARAWAGHADPDASGAAPASAADGDEPTTREARIAETIGWVAIAGAALAAAGFLLPWARTMIGASGDGYLDRWGFAGPGHPVLALAILAVLGLAVMKTRIPAWIRLGIAGLGLGALLLGLVWPYVFGPLGAQPGAFVSMAGALMLIGAGVASLVLDRHAGDRPVV